MTYEFDEELYELARPFPTDFVERKDGQDYVAHHVINQRLLSIVGPFDFELVQVIRGDVAAVDPDPSSRSRRGRAGTPALSQVVVGAIWRLTCHIDGTLVRVEEVGDVGDVHNWAHDGARLKDAASDALKRCAMRFGLGLHLWAQEHYFLDQQLRAQRPLDAPASERPAVPAPPPGAQRPVDPDRVRHQPPAEDGNALVDDRAEAGPPVDTIEPSEQPGVPVAEAPPPEEPPADQPPPAPAGWASWTEHDQAVRMLREMARALAVDDQAREVLRLAFVEETGIGDPQLPWIMTRAQHDKLQGRYEAIERARPNKKLEPPVAGEGEPVCGAVHPRRRSRVCVLVPSHDGWQHRGWDGEEWPAVANGAKAEGQ